MDEMKVRRLRWAISVVGSDPEELTNAFIEHFHSNMLSSSTRTVMD